jgi:hypothetical protein
MSGFCNREGEAYQSGGRSTWAAPSIRTGQVSAATETQQGVEKQGAFTLPVAVGPKTNSS